MQSSCKHTWNLFAPARRRGGGTFDYQKGFDKVPPSAVLNGGRPTRERAGGKPAEARHGEQAGTACLPRRGQTCRRRDVEGLDCHAAARSLGSCAVPWKSLDNVFSTTGGFSELPPVGGERRGRGDSRELVVP